MTRMYAAGPLIIALFLILQTGPVPDFPAGTFTKKEAEKIAKESHDIEERIKVYQKASERILKTVGDAVSGKKFEAVGESLSLWTALLTESLKDIEANLGRRKKKSKPLIKYEIQVRKAIKDLRDYKIRAPGGQQDAFSRCISLADGVRSRMVDILFNPDWKARK